MIKKVLPWMVFILLFALLIIGFSLKDNINKSLSELMKIQAPPEINHSGKALVDSLYNYSENGLKYDFTLLEFSSTGCAICKQMETVLEEIRNSEKAKVNVVFLHIMKSDNLDLMKYYGISAVPMQVLLDKQGKEFFRHYGFISANDILEKANTVLIQK